MYRKLPSPVIDSDKKRTTTQLEELLYAVERKFPGETRFQTALRYIREAETSQHAQGQATHQCL